MTKAVLLLAFLMLTADGSAVDAQPTELFACSPTCEEGLPTGGITTCGSNRWKRSLGAKWYGPLRAIGPIRISIDAQPWPLELPLLVQVRTRGPGAEGVCFKSSGLLVWETFGTSSCEQPWSTSPDIPVVDIFGMSQEYWVQLVGLIHLDGRESPAVACVKVEVVPTAIAQKSWSIVKNLYK